MDGAPAEEFSEEFWFWSHSLTQCVGSNPRSSSRKQMSAVQLSVAPAYDRKQFCSLHKDNKPEVKHWNAAAVIFLNFV